MSKSHKEVEVVKYTEKTYVNKDKKEIKMITYKLKTGGEAGYTLRPKFKENRFKVSFFNNKNTGRGSEYQSDHYMVLRGVEGGDINKLEGLIDDFCKEIEVPGYPDLEFKKVIDYPNKPGSSLKDTSRSKKAFIPVYDPPLVDIKKKQWTVDELIKNVGQEKKEITLIPIIKISSIKVDATNKKAYLSLRLQTGFITKLETKARQQIKVEYFDDLL